MKTDRFLFVCVFLFMGIVGSAQIISGPMPGDIDYRTARIWAEAGPGVDMVSVRYWKASENKNKFKEVFTSRQLGGDFNTVSIGLSGLDLNTTYEYEVVAHSEKGLDKRSGSFTTKDLWQWRKPAPDFSFLTGSCAYFNQPEFDRPGTPYGKDSSIFETMAKTPAQFMLWLGDNWYTREVDYFSPWGLYYRAQLTRSLPVMQNFWKAMPHYAIWDDHDYGWNDADKSYPLKEQSRQVFQRYWNNPSYGEKNEGTYTKITWNDADIFMLDDRWFRSNDEMPDSIHGKPNPDKRMWGAQQLEWLKNALLQSKTNGNIAFRIIATGSQVLNPMSPYDCARHFPAEYNELMQFLADNKIPGIIFLTGDRHHSEIIKLERKGNYTLYDITASPLTSGLSKFGGPEKNNPARVWGTDENQNFTKISITGSKKERQLTAEFFDPKGGKLGEWKIGVAALQ